VVGGVLFKCSVGQRRFYYPRFAQRSGKAFVFPPIPPSERLTSSARKHALLIILHPDQQRVVSQPGYSVQIHNHDTHFPNPKRHQAYSGRDLEVIETIIRHNRRQTLKSLRQYQKEEKICTLYRHCCCFSSLPKML